MKIEKAIKQLQEAILFEHNELTEKHKTRYFQLQATNDKQAEEIEGLKAGYEQIICTYESPSKYNNRGDATNMYSIAKNKQALGPAHITQGKKIDIQKALDKKNVTTLKEKKVSIEEQYFIFDETTNLYLKGYNQQKPLWTKEKNQAVKYNEMDALKQQRRIDNMYSPAHTIRLIELKTE